MCLAVPGKVIKTAGDDVLRMTRVDFGGVITDISPAYTPYARIGDHVLVHVGFAISVIDETEATRTFTALEELREPVAEQSGVAP